jgi:fructuronate reductase
MSYPRLNRTSLPTLSTHLLSSSWNSPGIGIVHLGLGNFHRAHQAIYTEEAVIKAGGNWAICGVTLRGSTTKRDALNEQDGLYTLIQRDGSGELARVVRILGESLALPYDWALVLARLCDPDVKIVSLTVTEKGYCRVVGTGNLKKDHPLIIHDLANPQNPKSVPGIVLAGLHARMKNGILPFTVLSCDNISKNGNALQRVVLEMTELLEQARPDYQGLSSWIQNNCKFPCTMVDRIVPETTEEDVQTALSTTHFEDRLPLSCEPFRQWVIEDNFTDGHPDWQSVGVQFVSDVIPFELAKLRMLNAAHSTLAYLSLLLDLKTIDEAISQVSLQSFLQEMMDKEIIPILMPYVPVELDLYRYRDALLRRFANPALKHRTAQIAIDGSEKVPQRLLSSIVDCKKLGQPYPRLAFAVGVWMTFLRGHSEQGVNYEIHDPLADQLRTIYNESGSDPHEYVESICSRTQVVPNFLKNSTDFREYIVHALKSIKKGVLPAIQAVQ